MSWRMRLRRWLPPVVADAVASVRGPGEARARERYLAGGRVPWSEGYGEFRTRAITAALDDPQTMARFRDGGSLPAGYGFGLDERCVEVPWVLGHLSGARGRALDAGSALNHPFILDRPELAGLKLHLVTLAPEAHCLWRLGHGYLFEDLRQLPLADATYDVVVCLSTLEHVGCDNRAYGADGPERPAGDDQRTVMAELRRVLRPGGTLLLTVPYGRDQDLVAFRQLDARRLAAAVDAFGAAAVDDRRFYRYRRDGWAPADPSDCADCESVDWICRLPEEREPAFPHQPDNAASARAVALVRLVAP